MHNFTQEDLLLSLYNETSNSHQAALTAALSSDWSLGENMDEMISVHKELSTIKFSPSSSTISSILNYAEKAISENAAV
jgi:hypothetical protein